MKRFWLLILFALSLALPAASASAATRQGNGQVRFRDGNALADKAIVTLNNATAPNAGTHYQAWLGVTDGSLWANLGTVALNTKGNGTLEWVAPTGENLVAQYTTMLVTVEADGQTLGAPDPTKIAYQGQIAPELLAPLRALVVAGADTPLPSRLGYAAGLKESTKDLASSAQRAQSAAKDKWREGLSRYNEAQINQIVGVLDGAYGDYDGDGVVTERGDSYGINRYVEAVRATVQPVLSSPTASEDSIARATRIITATNNILDWTGQVRNLALVIKPNTNFDDANVIERDNVWLANRAVYGADLNNDNTIDAAQGEAGGSALYSTALDLGRISLRPLR